MIYNAGFSVSKLAVFIYMYNCRQVLFDINPLLF